MLSHIKMILATLLFCGSAVNAAGLAAMKTELKAELPNDRAGVAIGYLSPETETTQFIGNTSLTDKTLFEYGSITKVFTAILLAELAQKQVVSPADSMNVYLPKDVQNGKWQDVTLQDLATHTAGLPISPPIMNFLYFVRWGDESYARFDETMLFEAVEQVKLEPIGQFNTYSNFGFGLLGTLLSRATETPYKTLVEDRVFKPLGMQGATMTGWSSKAIAPPFTDYGWTAGYWDWDALAGAGAARGSLTDALTFLKASITACKTSGALAEANCKAQQATGVKVSKYAAQGLGWIRSASQAGDVVWHNGGSAGYSAFLGFNAKTGEGLVLLANVGDIYGLLTQVGLERLAKQE